MLNASKKSPNPRLETWMQNWFPILLVLLFGMIFLMKGSASLALWSDEAWSAVTAQQPTVSDMIEMIQNDFHPPLYFTFLYGWQKIAGDSVLALRYLSIITTLLAGAVTYRFTLSLFGRRVALLAALFFLLHDLTLVLGEEVRPYPQAQLLTVLTMWQYWHFWQKPTKRRGVCFALSGAALLWTLYWGGFVLLSLGVHALITRFHRLRPFILVYICIGLLFLPWVPYVQAMLDRAPRGLHHALTATIADYKILAFQLLGTPEVFWAGLAILGVMGARRRRPTAASSLPALVFGMTLAMSVVINANYQSLSFRSLSILIPAFAILIAHTLASFCPYESSVMISIALAIALSSTASQSPARVTTFGSFVDFLVDHSTSSDIVVSDMQWESMQMAYHLNRHPDNPRYRLNEFDFRHVTEARVDFASYLTEGLTNFDGVWLVKMDNYSPRRDTITILQTAGFEHTTDLVWEDDFLPIQLLRFDRLARTSFLTTFAERMQLRHSNVTVHEHGIGVNLLWVTTQPLGRNYTVSAFLLDTNGGLVAQHDSYPMDGYSPTVTWELGRYYYDSHLVPTADLLPGTYQVGLQVYTFVDGGQGIEPALPSDCEDPACRFIILDTVTVD